MSKCLRCGAGPEWLQGDIPVAVTDQIVRQQERIAELEALLDRSCHMPVLDTNDELVCATDCARCAWERMKGEAK